MLQSLRDFENNQMHFDNYENGITYLERQVKKSLIKLEGKNKELKKVYQELNDLRE